MESPDGGSAWDTLPPLIAPAVELARSEGVTLVVETGNGVMVNSNHTARKLIDDLDTKDVLKVLWDPANTCWRHERAYPDGYQEVRDGYLGHIHIKDVQVARPVRPWRCGGWGKGDSRPCSSPSPTRCAPTDMKGSSRLRACITLETATSKLGFGCA